MSHLQGGINRKSSTTELEIIKQKRTALQNLVKLTSMLHQLSQGLQSVIIMGKSAARIPDKIVSKFKSLSEGLKNKPTDTLKNTLCATDQKIQSDIKHVLEISQKSDVLLEQQLGATGSKLVDVLKEDYHEYVSDFKKKSQTSITLRIALKTRNAIVTAFNLPVPESFIQQQVVSLNIKEEECRQVIKKDISSLQNDLIVLMKKSDCPDDVKKILVDIQSDLKANADHFNSGKSIEDMPIIYESIELSGAPQVVEEVEEVIKANRPEVEKTPAPVVEELIKEPVKRKPGAFKHLWLWLNSPWKKEWKDID